LIIGFDVSRDQDTISVHTRKLTLVSAGVHLMFFLWMMLFRTFSPEHPGLTEITWIEPAEAAPAALPSVITRSDEASHPEIAKQPPSPRERKELFRRDLPIADIAPNPQELKATEDRLTQRLATLQRKAVEKPTQVAALTTPSPVGRPRLAGVSNEQHPARDPVDLSRTERVASTPIQLQRTKARPQQAVIISSPVVDTQVERAKPKETESVAQRTLAGAKMTGPVADRPIKSYTTPAYPEWAKIEAVEGSVTIYFVVLPDGRVKENVMVEKTSGFADFDNNAVEALRTWLFEALKGGATGEQWGTITFHYRLSDTN
jgi:TonB family protein